MKKRILSMLLVIVMVLSFVPAFDLTAFAAGDIDYTVYLGADGVAKKYDISTSQPTGDALTLNSGDLSGLSWDSDKSQWKMNGFQFTTAAGTAIVVADDVTIFIGSGDNKITAADSDMYSRAMIAKGDLVFAGDGELHLKTGTAVNSSIGLYVYNTLKVEGDCKVTVETVDFTCTTIGVNVANQTNADIALDVSAELYCISGDTTQSTFAVKVEGGIRVGYFGLLSAVSGDATNNSSSTAVSAGSNKSTITVLGKMIAQAGAVSGNGEFGIGVYSDTKLVVSGDVEASAGVSTNGANSIGVATMNDIRVEGTGYLCAQGNDQACYITKSTPIHTTEGIVAEVGAEFDGSDATEDNVELEFNPEEDIYRLTFVNVTTPKYVGIGRNYGIYLDDGAVYQVTYDRGNNDVVPESKIALDEDDFAGLSWNAKNKRWVMEDFTFVSNYRIPVGVSPDCDTVELKGNNIIRGGASDISTAAVKVDGSLTFKGDGSLDATSGVSEFVSSAIYANKTLTVDKNVTLKATTCDSQTCYGILVENASAVTDAAALTIAGKVTVTAGESIYGKNDQRASLGVFCIGNMTIEKSGDLNITTGVGEASTTGINIIYYSLIVDGRLNISTGKVPEASETMGVACGSMKVSGVADIRGNLQSKNSIGVFLSVDDYLQISDDAVFVARGALAAVSVEKVKAPTDMYATADAEAYGESASTDNVKKTEIDETTSEFSFDITVPTSTKNPPCFIQFGTNYAIYLKNTGKAYLAERNGSSFEVGGEMTTIPEGLKWDTETSRWVMTDFEFTTAAPMAIMFDKDCNIVEISGKNKIESANSTPAGFESYGVYADGDLTITGDGYLEAVSGTYGDVSTAINIPQGKLTIDKDATVLAKSGISLTQSYGVFGCGIAVDGKLTALSSTSQGSVAVVSEKDIVVTGELKAITDNAWCINRGALDYGILTMSNITVEDGGALLAAGYWAAYCLFSPDAKIYVPDDTEAVGGFNMNGMDASADLVTVSGGELTYTIPPRYLLVGTFKDEATGCIYSDALTAGDAQTLILGDTEAGEYKITGNAVKGFQLSKGDKFVSVVNGKVKADATGEYTWKYDGGLYTEVKTTVVTRTLFWSKTSVKTVKYYLAFDGENFILTNNKTNAFVQVISDEHCIAYKHDGDGKHVAYCTKCDYVEEAEAHEYDDETHLCKCGKYDPDACGVTSVKVNKTVVKTYVGLLFWKRAVYSYQYTVKPTLNRATVKSVYVSADGENWKYGSIFTSNLPYSELYIKITDNLGHETKWKYENGTVTQIKDESDALYEDESYLWWPDAEPGSAAAVKSITFTKHDTVPTYTKTWDAPANATAYFDAATGALTFMLDEGVEEFVLNDSNLFRTVPNILSDEQYEAFLPLFGGVIKSVDDLKGLVSNFNKLYRAIEEQDKEKILEYANGSISLMEAASSLGDGAADYTFDTYDELIGFYHSLEAIKTSTVEFFTENMMYFGLIMAGDGEGVTVTGLDLFNVSAVTDFSRMFFGLTSKNELTDILDFDVSNGKYFDWMFAFSVILQTGDFSKWDTSNAVDMTEMFANSILTTFTTGDKFSTENVTNMSGMFRESLIEEIDISMFDTSNVTLMSDMFFECCELTKADLRGSDENGIDLSNVTNMRGMFSTCDVLEEVIFGKVDTSKVTDMSNMFSSCCKLKNVDVGEFDTDSVTRMKDMFLDCPIIQSLDTGNWDTSKVTDFGRMFKGCYELSTLNVTNWDTLSAENMHEMFYDCRKLSTLNVSNWKTENVTDMEEMFLNCQALNSLDLSGWDTTKVEKIKKMFCGCGELTSLQLGAKFTTKNITDFSDLFAGCAKLLTLDLSKFDTSKATTMAGMFNGCATLSTLTLNNFDTSKATTMAGMFNGCATLSTLTLNNFDTSKVTTMKEMFSGCSGLTTLDIDSFNTENVTTMENMFKNCNSLSVIDLSSFDTAKVTCMEYMFAMEEGNITLEHIYVDDGWVTTALASVDEFVFANCNGLEGFSPSNISSAFAKVGDGGYLEMKIA